MSTSGNTAKPVQRLRAHVFVCTNERTPGHPRGCCKLRGSEEVLKVLKSEIAALGLGSVIRAQKAGCLDTCEHGPSVVIYPDNVWYGGVGPEDAKEIVQSHLVGGQAVERLRIVGK